MISDTLSDAVNEINEYLTHAATADCYTGNLKLRIEALIQMMDAIRQELDTPPEVQ